MTVPTSSGTQERSVSPPSVHDNEVVLAQLERIVESPAFRYSKRYPRFLRFIVEQTLLDHANRLKERLLGIEVFDRVPDYDLATDPIVRVAAGEIRKRLAQYYVESGHENELRIQLQAGSYVPEFHAPQTANGYESASNQTPATISSQEAPSGHASGGRLTKVIAAVVTVFGLAAILCLFLIKRPTPIEEFWQPFLKSANSPLICLGDHGPSLPNGGGEESAVIRTGVNSYDHLALGDVETLNRISTVLAQKGKTPSVLNSRSASLADLRRQPAVLIGGSPNQWTMRYMQYLRYQLVPGIRPGVNAIFDREDASRPRWSVDFNVPYSAIPKEYAIVARFQNPTTGLPTMIAAGVGANGQVAAAEFLTNPDSLRDFIQHAPRGWKDKNIEIILETQMINGDNGPPRVVATYLW
jgi:hypothetical protein